MGFFGGILGILIGTGAVYIMNAWLANTRIVLFLITPRLLVIAMLFCHIDRCFFRALSCIQSLENEPYGGFEACMKWELKGKD